MIDCYMALDVPYAIDLANAVREANLFWIEEALPPHDLESHKYIKKACPWQKWTKALSLKHWGRTYEVCAMTMEFLKRNLPAGAERINNTLNLLKMVKPLAPPIPYS